MYCQQQNSHSRYSVVASSCRWLSHVSRKYADPHQGNEIIFHVWTLCNLYRVGWSQVATMLLQWAYMYSIRFCNAFVDIVLRDGKMIWRTCFQSTLIRFLYTFEVTVKYDIFNVIWFLNFIHSLCITKKTWSVRIWICFYPQAKVWRDSFWVGSVNKGQSQSLDSHDQWAGTTYITLCLFLTE